MQKSQEKQERPTNKKIVVFTHNDLDALGCMLNIHFRLPETEKEFFWTNYVNIKEITDSIVEYVKQNTVEKIIIADVSFSDNPECLRKLVDCIGAKNCVVLNHHLYPEGFWDEFQDITVKWDKTKCAATLCNEVFGNKGKNTNLDKLTRVIDIYDLWQSDHKAFELAQDLNNYFWNSNIWNLYLAFIENDYRLPNDFLEVTGDIRKEQEEGLKKYENSGLIHRNSGITIAFINDHFNRLIVDDMKNGQDFVISINQYGITRVRVNRKSSMTLEQLAELRLELIGVSDIGHAHAFTYKIKGPNGETLRGKLDIDKLILEAERITSSISRILGS